MILKAQETILGISSIKKFSEDIHVCYKTAQILSQRGIDTEEKFNKYISPSIEDLRDPFLLNGMKEAKQRIQKAIDSHESVLIFGDYDVDGISAVAILYKFLKDKTGKLNYFLPNRYVDGYGLTIESAKKVIEKFKPNLVITVDCGISCFKEVEYIKSQNIDVIITDHHEMPEVLPQTIVVDPKIPGQKYGFNGLCGAGVALKVVEAFIGKYKLNNYLPICALATVSDIVPLVDENRSIVKLGLSLQNLLPKGIRLLAKNLKLKTINSLAISFKIAPRLNAAGRMGNAYTALDLYLLDDDQEIKNSLNLMLKQNEERQKLSQKIYDECIALIEENKLYKQNAIILKSKNWDSGLLGIACARLVDDFFRPVFLFSEENGILKGSVRSIDNVNIHTLLSNCSNLLESFGGHSMAAGLSLSLSHYSEFQLYVYNYLEKNVDKKFYIPTKHYDVKIDIGEMTINFVKELQLLEPFGCGNPNPNFLVQYDECSVSRLTSGSSHLNIGLNKNVKLLAFNAIDFLDDYEYSKTKQSIVELQVDSYKNKEYLCGIVKYTSFSGYSKKLETLAMGRVLKQLYYSEKSYKQTISFDVENLDSLLNEKLKTNHGTVIVINSMLTYKKVETILKKYQLSCFIGGSQSKIKENCIVLALDDISSIKDYSTAIFCDSIISRGFVESFKGSIYQINKNAINFSQFDLNRSYFGLIYVAIRNLIKQNISYDNEYDFYENLIRYNRNLRGMTYSQFVCAFYTFIDLGIVKVDKTYGYIVYIDDTKKCKLENSAFYNKLELL